MFRMERLCMLTEENVDDLAQERCVGGGAHGLLIVEDEPGDIDLRVMEMVELCLVFWHIYDASYP